MQLVSSLGMSSVVAPETERRARAKHIAQLDEDLVLTKKRSIAVSVRIDGWHPIKACGCSVFEDRCVGEVW